MAQLKSTAHYPTAWPARAQLFFRPALMLCEVGSGRVCRPGRPAGGRGAGGQEPPVHHPPEPSRPRQSQLPAHLHNRIGRRSEAADSGPRRRRLCSSTVDGASGTGVRSLTLGRQPGEAECDSQQATMERLIPTLPAKHGETEFDIQQSTMERKRLRLSNQTRRGSI